MFYLTMHIAHSEGAIMHREIERDRHNDAPRRSTAKISIFMQNTPIDRRYLRLKASHDAFRLLLR